jgi:hypothetical protein
MKTTSHVLAVVNRTCNVLEAPNRVESQAAQQLLKSQQTPGTHTPTGEWWLHGNKQVSRTLNHGPSWLTHGPSWYGSRYMGRVGGTGSWAELVGQVRGPSCQFVGD